MKTYVTFQHVSNKNRQQTIEKSKWLDFLKKNPNALIYWKVVKEEEREDIQIPPEALGKGNKKASKPIGIEDVEAGHITDDIQ